ncbi:E7 protein [Okapia johnstoni papillomavirus 1]|uniref:E7 protein n=1 Tax=Okapia johnstoni papillomavirus 1 TaxID=2304449 RepID=A0A346LUY2_9PAPI|nr:E7 protein [Okapia johnstoni papillomavirus 1]
MHGPSTTKNLHQDESPGLGTIVLLLQPLETPGTINPPFRPRPKPRNRQSPGLFLIGFHCGNCPQPLHMLAKACPSAVSQLEDLLAESVSIFCPACGKLQKNGK